MAGAAGMPASMLLAYDDFQGAEGPFDNLASGAGWKEPWNVQNDDVMQPGWSVTAAQPLTFGTLASNASHMIGGRGFLAAGRFLDRSATGPFASYLDASNFIGASGKELWMSVLIRRDTTSSAYDVALHRSNAAHWDGDPGAPSTVAIGYFGAASDDAGKKWWSLRVHSAVTRSDVEVVVGQTVLAVVHMKFGSPNTVRLYLNPSTLGGDPPATPTLEVTDDGTKPLSFQAFKSYPGSSAGYGALDEIRFGTSFAAVTPTQ